MVTAPEAHNVALLAPWYAPPGRTVAIHRYLDPNFVAQFQSDVSNSPTGNTNLFAWESEDRMLGVPGTPLKLRRPVHRTFHIVAWEASCILHGAPRGMPAMTPNRIASAGFVIRNSLDDTGFQITRGTPQGWGPVDPGADPDASRQIKALGLVPQAAVANPGYTGEETYPLHKLPVTDGNTPHTLLFGYLPIGGADYVPPNPPALDTGSDLPEDLPWPFGTAGRSGPPPPYTFDRQIDGGTIHAPFAAVLRVLLGRYQFADTPAWSDPQNAPIVSILDSLSFYADPPEWLYGQALRDFASANLSGVTLGDVLRQTQTSQPLLTALMIASSKADVPLPDDAALPADFRNLLVVEQVAAQLRAALRYRLAEAIVTATAGMPEPKLASGPSGRYVVVPFLRVIRPDGCERVVWGRDSAPFAVAAAFDPDAARPSRIEMPDLSDAMHGLAKGASFDMPPSLANLMNGLNSKAATQQMMTGGGGSTSGLGVRSICSFSLPSITICAMIMLSITLSLLNIFLGWMAWVKICLPLPAKK